MGLCVFISTHEGPQPRNYQSSLCILLMLLSQIALEVIFCTHFLNVSGIFDVFSAEEFSCLSIYINVKLRPLLISFL